METTTSLPDLLWGKSPLERIRAAKSVGPQELREVTAFLLTGCPSQWWPYGCSTSINPWMVFLGPSPGTSPAAGDSNYKIQKGSPPTAGSPPESMVYSDSHGFFDRLRSLTLAVVGAEASESISSSDSIALAAMMNLDSGASGEANKVQIDTEFASWSIDVTIRRLKPRYVVGVGLSGFLKKPEHRWLCELMGTYVGAAFNPNRAPIMAPLQAYPQKRYMFRAWPLENGGANPQHLILLPQHPSRAPMTSPTVWADTVQEFIAFAKAL